MGCLPENIKAVLFDKDGTLILFEESWRPVILKAVAELSGGDKALASKMLNAAGYDTDDEKFVAGGILAGGTTEEVVTCWREFVPHVTQTQFKQLEKRMLAEQTLVPVPGLVPHLSRLKQRGLILGVATNDSEAMAKAHIAQCGCSAHFSYVVGSDSGFGGKPEPGMFNAFCEQVDLPPQSVAMVGDNWQDMEMAKRAGAGHKIGVLTGTSDRKVLAEISDVVLDSFIDISPVKA